MKKIIIIILFLPLYLVGQGQDSQLSGRDDCPFEISNVQAITPDGERYTRPKISPDGTKVFFTKSNRKGLYLVDIKARGEIRTITEDVVSSSKYSWTNNNEEIVYYKKNILKGNGPKKKLVKYDIVNNSEVVFEEDVKNKFILKNNTIKLSLNLIEDKVEAFDGGKTWFVTPEQGGYYNIILSPDKTKVIVHSDHIYIYSIDGKEKIDTGLEMALASDWSSDGKYFLYFIEVDDGHTYLSSDLYIYSIEKNKSWKLTDTSNLMESWATWSIDGRIITFGDYSSGKIFIADLKIK